MRRCIRSAAGAALAALQARDAASAQALTRAHIAEGERAALGIR